MSVLILKLKSGMEIRDSFPSYAEARRAMETAKELMADLVSAEVEPAPGI